MPVAWLMAAIACLPGGCQQQGGSDAGLSRPPVATPVLARQPATGDPDAGAARQTAAARAPLLVGHWQCGDLRMTLERVAAGGAATLHVSGAQLPLAAATSGLPGHYGDLHGNSLQVQDRRAQLLIAGEERRDCVQATQPSPWYDARKRGMAFRAVGSEPGWFMEIGAGAAPRLNATLDYGEREVEATVSVMRRGEVTAYRGTTSDGSPVSVQARRESCADGMSGERFAARVELVIDGRRHEGCGAFLLE